MDQRTRLERWLDDHVGRPLYYCDACQRPIKVIERDGKIDIQRKCRCDAPINAPRKVFLYGKDGELTWMDKWRVAWSQIASAITGRCV